MSRSACGSIISLIFQFRLVRTFVGITAMFHLPPFISANMTFCSRLFLALLFFPFPPVKHTPCIAAITACRSRYRVRKKCGDGTIFCKHPAYLGVPDRAVDSSVSHVRVRSGEGQKWLLSLSERLSCREPGNCRGFVPYIDSPLSPYFPKGCMSRGSWGEARAGSRAVERPCSNPAALSGCAGFGFALMEVKG